MKDCQFCKEQMRADAKACPHCGKLQWSTGEEAAAGSCMLIIALPFLLVLGYLLYAIFTAPY
jgi:hypothetical protein